MAPSFSPSPNSRRAVFLDRDGVIIENRSNYIRAWEDVEVLPGSMEALARLSESDYLIVIVTNQSAVGRGILEMDVAEGINERLVALIEAAGGRVDAVYMCPHDPAAGCDCRKPRPGMFIQAALELGLDMDRSLMIGDALTDLTAAREAGVARLALVLTGRGRQQAEAPGVDEFMPLATYDHLADALADLVK